MAFTTLISPAELAAHRHASDWLVADCRFDLKEPDAGERAYRERHLPGAIYVHLDRDLSGPKTGHNGRHPLPSPEAAAATFGRLGIDKTRQVVVYDQDSGMFASRLWWMLRWLGHDAVAVLDGGFARWVAEGHPVVSGHDTRPPARFVASPRAEMLVSVNDVQRLTGAGYQLLDARAPERYRGDVEPLDRVPGRIPGARNHFFQSNLTNAATFRPAGELAAQLEASLGGTPADRTICYCGSGVTACHDLLALEHAGLRGGRLYAGSWSEWCADPARPVEKG